MVAALRHVVACALDAALRSSTSPSLAGGNSALLAGRHGPVDASEASRVVPMERGSPPGTLPRSQRARGDGSWQLARLLLRTLNLRPAAARRRALRSRPFRRFPSGSEQRAVGSGIRTGAFCCAFMRAGERQACRTCKL